MLKKAHRGIKDPWLAILDWKNTPYEQIGTSPVQRLIPRRNRTRLPTADELLNPEVVAGVTQKIERRRKKAKFYYDRTARHLPELITGDHVRLEPRPNDCDRTWKSGTCISKVGPRSYLVDSEDVTENSSDPQMRKVGVMISRYLKAHVMRMREKKDLS